jgi:hypothetical protein
MMFGLWLTRTTLVPAGGGVAASVRKAAVRRLFSLGETTRPPSLMSAVDDTSPTPSSVPVSTARWNRLVWTLPTGILSLRSESPIDLAAARSASLSCRWWAVSLRSSGLVSAWSA